MELIRAAESFILGKGLWLLIICCVYIIVLISHVDYFVCIYDNDKNLLTFYSFRIKCGRTSSVKSKLFSKENI